MRARLRGQDQGLPTLRTFLCYSALNLLLVLLAACMVLFVGPAAAGSGIPDVKVPSPTLRGESCFTRGDPQNEQSLDAPRI